MGRVHFDCSSTPVRHWFDVSQKKHKKEARRKIFEGRVFDSSRTLVNAHLGPTGSARPDCRLVARAASQFSDISKVYSGCVKTAQTKQISKKL